MPTTLPPFESGPKFWQATCNKVKRNRLQNWDLESKEEKKNFIDKCKISGAELSVTGV